jgi:hypothetical protein
MFVIDDELSEKIIVRYMHQSVLFFQKGIVIPYVFSAKSIRFNGKFYVWKPWDINNAHFTIEFSNQMDEELQWKVGDELLIENFSPNCINIIKK